MEDGPIVVFVRPSVNEQYRN